MTKCELCGKEFMRHSPTQKFCCRECYEEFKLRQRPPGKRRFSGRSYKNSEQRLNEIKEKYKNGITADILREFAENLRIPREFSRENGGDKTGQQLMLTIDGLNFLKHELCKKAVVDR